MEGIKRSNLYDGSMGSMQDVLVYARYKYNSHPAWCSSKFSAAKKADKEVRKAKYNYEKKLVVNIKKDAKSFYAYMRRPEKTKIRVGPLVDGNWTLKASSEDMSKELNLYYASIFTQEYTASIQGEKQMFQGPASENLSNLRIDKETVWKTLSELKHDKAAGADGISPSYWLR